MPYSPFTTAISIKVGPRYQELLGKMRYQLPVSLAYSPSANNNRPDLDRKAGFEPTTPHNAVCFRYTISETPLLVFSAIYDQPRDGPSYCAREGNRTLCHRRDKPTL